MNTVEQGFLVPTSPKVIWAYISDINNNPRWQTDCKQVAILTYNQRGRGMRWRQTTHGGRDHVCEVTAWYEEVGYEYKIVDGSPFTENVGRLKLHETPDGTEIIWEFHYAVGGVLGGLRNTLATKRTLENNFAESLWRLWEYVGSIPKAERDAWVAKSLMREAPDVESRAQYQSRHGASSPIPPSVPITEPPVKQDDTRPRPAEPADSASEPDFLTDVSAPAQEPSEPTPAAAFNLQEKTDTSELHYLDFSESPPAQSVSDEQAGEWDAPTDPHLQVPQEMIEAATEKNTTEPAPSDKAEIITQEEAGMLTTEVMPTASEQVDDDIDTSRMSVFEVFGVQRPSETQESAAVKVDEPQEQAENLRADEAPVTVTNPPVEKVVHPTTNPTRIGLRVLLRHRLIRVRQPKKNM